MYQNCQYTYSYNYNDTTDLDSLGYDGYESIDQDIELDEEGNPVVRPQNTDDTETETTKPKEGNPAEANEQKKNAQPQYEDVYF